MQRTPVSEIWGFENNGQRLFKNFFFWSVPCHIVHASSHQVLDIVKQAKEEGSPLTVETCYHYLTLESENVEKGDTSHKCCPPIREKDNQVHHLQE